jgi:hypothetical protein
MKLCYKYQLRQMISHFTLKDLWNSNTFYIYKKEVKILEFHPARPEDHLAQPSPSPKFIFKYPTYAWLPFIPAQIKPDLFTIWPNYYIFLLMHKCQ